MIRRFLIIIILSLLIFSCKRYNSVFQNDAELPTSIPEGVRIFKARDGEIGIEWIKYEESNLKGYNIYRADGDSSTFEFLDFTETDYYLDDSLDYDMEYFYKLTSVNKNGVESKFSKTVSAKPVNIYPPLPPYQIDVNAQNWNDDKKIIISWIPFENSDISHFEIYRKTIDNEFTQDDLLGITNQFFFTDTIDVQILRKYYYTLKAVDKGGLKSNYTRTVSDIILDAPKLIYPVDLNILASPFEFIFVTSGAPANYKLFIQSNQFLDIIDEISIYSNNSHDTLTISYDPHFLQQNHTYYWRVAAYTNSLDNANSFSEMQSFTIIAGN